jgi:hypothetical protein
MCRADHILKLSIVCLLASLCSYGCGSSTTGKIPPPSYFRLKTIGLAYAKATESLERPPKNKEELMQFLKFEADPENPQSTEKVWQPDDILRSTSDGEEFVIHYGADFRDYNDSRTPANIPVLAYEKHGRDGKRQVLRLRWVTVMTDDELANLKFPTGYHAPIVP